jgi:hypothetical protein
MYKKFTHLSLAILLFLSFVLIDSVKASTAPGLIDRKPGHGDQHVPLTTDLSFQFNQNVVSIDRTKVKFYRKDTNNRYYEEQIKEVKISNDKVTIIPFYQLTFNQEYKIEIEGYSIQLTNGYYSSKLTTNFKTNYMNFHELMAVGNTKLESLLNTYTARKLIVSAPKRYVDEVQIHHKTQGKTKEDPKQTVTESLTNIDILVNDTNISKVNVKILNNKNGKIINNRDAKKMTEGNKTFFTLSHGKLPSNFDVKITVVDRYNETMDELILKVVSEDNLFTEVSEKYKYETAGKSFTLYELVSDENLFNKLLAESNIKKIMVQVAP